MEITIVGSGCGIPNAERGSPCVAVRIGDETLVFDCGPGALRGMALAGIEWANLDAVFATHFHTDHIADIAALLFAYIIPDVERTEPLTLYGPPGMKKLYDNFVVAYGDWLIPRTYDLAIEELLGEPLKKESWIVETAPSKHSQPSYAYRLEADGAAVVYTGDTDYSEEVARLASGCDLLILECSYPNALEASGHLTPKKAGEMAHIAGCKKLALTHIYPICGDYDLVAECKHTYDGDVVLAKDGMRFEMG